MKSLFCISIFFVLCSTNLSGQKRQIPDGARMSYLENGHIKIGIDLNLGGAIVYLAPVGGENLINNYDYGRQVQLSFYSGPVPYLENGQKPSKHWAHIGWNPIQTGDDFGNTSRVVDHENDGKTLRVTCRPMQWPLNNIPADCLFESRIELEGPVVKGLARLKNTRQDRTWYPARLQELPAVYANGRCHRVVSYTGDRPFTGEPTSEIPKPVGAHPWSFWQGTENWAALLNEQNFGLGLITPGRVHFTGGFAGTPGPNDSFANSTGYLAGQGQEILDHNIEYEYRYELVVGKLEEIRARADNGKPAHPPRWSFANSRDGWHYRNATDAGWPVTGHLRINLDEDDPQLISPYFFLRAEQAAILEIEAAFVTEHRSAILFWHRHGQAAPAGPLRFPINLDGGFHTYRIDLSSSPDYSGTISRLRIDPVANGKKGDIMKIRSVRFIGE